MLCVSVNMQGIHRFIFICAPFNLVNSYLSQSYRETKTILD